PGTDPPGSEWLIRAADRPDPRPLWVAVWGGTADLAQALWKVQQTRPAARVAAFRARLRVHAIGDQDSTGPWIRKEFPDLFYLHHRVGYRGMYRGGDGRLVDSDWVEANVKRGGARGALYRNSRGGDIWGRTLGPVRGVKEGDTPSFLNLVANGLTDPAEPTWGGWGGRFVRVHPA